MQRFSGPLLGLAVMGLMAGPLFAMDRQPAIADVHLHFNWDQVEVLEAEEAVQRLQENGVVFGVVSSKPPVLALRLAEASGGLVIPLFMPYLEPERKRDWFFDQRVLPAARKALESGGYKGLGEMHLIAGFTPSLKQHNEIIDGLVALAEEFGVPASIHAEASSYRYFLPLCQRHPGAKIYWAHAGGILPPEEVADLMRDCPNVWVDLSARDPLRYGAMHPITDQNGVLLPPWERFVLEFQDRIMLGSDPFYRESLASWDEPNTGWDYLTTFLDFHRKWLGALPELVREKIARQNARRFFDVDPAAARR